MRCLKWKRIVGAGNHYYKLKSSIIGTSELKITETNSPEYSIQVTVTSP